MACSSNTIPAGNNSGLYGNPAGVSQSVGNYGNANVAGFLPIYSGDMGNIGNITASGNVVANKVYANAFLYANGVSIIQTNIYGNSNVAAYLPNNNANISAPYISVSGNIATGSLKTDNYLYANGTPVNFATYGNSNVASYLPTYLGQLNGNSLGISGVITTAGLSVTGQTSLVGVQANNISANTISVLGGANLGVIKSYDAFTGIDMYPANGVVTIHDTLKATTVSATNYTFANGAPFSSYGNANVAAYLPVYGGNILASTVSATANVVGNLVQTTGVGGDITGPNRVFATTFIGNLSAVSNVVTGSILTNNYLWANGVPFTTPTSYGNANVTALLASGAISTDISTTGNVNALVVNAANLRTTAATLALGTNAGANAQGTYAIAVGQNAGQSVQGTQSVAIGLDAGQSSQGRCSVAIGTKAGQSGQANNTIVINASGNALNGSTANALYVSPIRNDLANTANSLYYNTATKEITYGPGGGGSGTYGNANVTTLLASGNVSTPIITTGNIVGGKLFGCGANITGLPASYSNANVTTLLASGNVSTPIITTGNIVGAKLFGCGANITGLPAGNYSNTNVAAYLSSGTLNSNIITTANAYAATISTTGTQGNIVGPNYVFANTFVGNTASFTGDILQVGNILPITSNVYSLGSPTLQWKHLYVSNTSVYIDCHPLRTSTVCGVTSLTFDGAPVVTSGPCAPAITGNITTSGCISGCGVYGNTLSSAGNVYGSKIVGTFYGCGANITGLPAGYTNANVTTLLASGNVATDIITTGNVHATKLFGCGANITGIPSLTGATTGCGACQNTVLGVGAGGSHNSVVLGYNASTFNGGGTGGEVIIGEGATGTYGGQCSVVIGRGATVNAGAAFSVIMGACSTSAAQQGIAIGYRTHAANTGGIAFGTCTTATHPGFYVAPVRCATTAGGSPAVVGYCSGTREFVYGVSAGGCYGNANVETLLSSGSVTTDIITTGNVYGNAIHTTAITPGQIAFGDSCTTALVGSCNFVFSPGTSSLTVSGDIVGGCLHSSGNVSAVGEVYGTQYNLNSISGGLKICAGIPALVANTAINCSPGFYTAPCAVYAFTGPGAGSAYLWLGSQNFPTVIDTNGNVYSPGIMSAAGNVYGTAIHTTAVTPGQVAFGDSCSSAIVGSCNFVFSPGTSSLTVSGAIVGGNINTGGNVSATGSITGNSIVGNVYNIGGQATLQTAGPNSALLLAGTANTAGFFFQGCSQSEVFAAQCLSIFSCYANVIVNSGPHTWEFDINNNFSGTGNVFAGNISVSGAVQSGALAVTGTQLYCDSGLVICATNSGMSLVAHTGCGGTDVTLSIAGGKVSATGEIYGTNIHGTEFFGSGAGLTCLPVTPFGNNIAIGYQAGSVCQQPNAIAIGSSAGINNQGPCAIAIGRCAARGCGVGCNNQGANAIAIGKWAGLRNQGACAIAIGRCAGQTNQAPNSIILNATGSCLASVSVAGFFVDPVRCLSVTSTPLYYNTGTREISSGPVITPTELVNGTSNIIVDNSGPIIIGSGGFGNVLTINQGNIAVVGNLTTTGNATFSSDPNAPSTIFVNGTSYNSQLSVTDVGNEHVAQILVSRASDNLQVVTAFAYNPSNCASTNVAVTNGQAISSMEFLAQTGTQYGQFAQIDAYAAGSGTITDGSSNPGALGFSVTPDGSIFPAQVLLLDQDLSATFAGNVSAANVIGTFYGCGLNITGLPSGYSNANVTTLLASGNVATDYLTTGNVSATGNILTAGLVSATGNIRGNVHIGNGAGLTSLVGANITGAVANATFATSAGSAVGTAATVTTNAQPNITSVGTLTSLSVTGIISTAGNIRGNVLFGNGSQLTGLPAGTSIVNSTSNISIPSPGGPISVYAAGARVAYFYGNYTALGYQAGLSAQGAQAVAIGCNAGYFSQHGYAIAVGRAAGYSAQGNNAIAIGQTAGFQSQGGNTIAIGYGAGYSAQGNNSIIINATGANLNQTTANTFTVAPVRSVSGTIAVPAVTPPSGFFYAAYNPTTGEFIYYN